MSDSWVIVNNNRPRYLNVLDQGKVETEKSFPKTNLKKMTSLKTLLQRKIDVRALQGLLFVNFQKTDPNTSTLYRLLGNQS